MFDDYVDHMYPTEREIKHTKDTRAASFVNLHVEIDNDWGIKNEKI